LQTSAPLALLLVLAACGGTANAQEPTPTAEMHDPILPASPTNPNTMEPSIAIETQPTPAAKAETSRSIRVTIKGFRNAKGQALVSLFASAKGFPDKGKIAQERKAYRIVGEQIEIRFDDVKPGTYAIAVLHDEDKDFKMKTGLFGIPKEGYGASNGASSRFGPPKFSDAKFNVTSKDDVQLTISMIYH
tara:strand:- start:63807 stop:64373 length:567 start_codon:yes stop_codon:yes gene_type:complete